MSEKRLFGEIEPETRSSEKKNSRPKHIRVRCDRDAVCRKEGSGSVTDHEESDANE